MIAVTRQQVRGICCWQVQGNAIREFELTWQLQSSGQDAHNLIQLAIELQIAAENIRIGSELLLPEFIADDSFMIVTRTIFFRQNARPRSN